MSEGCSAVRRAGGLSLEATLSLGYCVGVARVGIRAVIVGIGNVGIRGERSRYMPSIASACVLSRRGSLKICRLRSARLVAASLVTEFLMTLIVSSLIL